VKNNNMISRKEADDLVKIREAQILSAIKGFRVHFTWGPSATFDDVQKMTAESYVRAVEYELNRDKTMGPFESLDEIKAREFQRAFARAIEVVRTWGSEEYEKHHIVDGSHAHVIYTLARLDAMESLQQMKKDKT